jgi:hypothetical protein
MADAPLPPPAGPAPASAPKLLSLKPARLWRIHQARFRPAQFHPGTGADARFSPIHCAAAKPIPTLYAASTLEGALMETVFHDVPTPPADYILDIERLQELALSVSVIRPKGALSLIDLSTKGLQRLGLQRTQLVDTPVRAYPATRRWAEWLHGVEPGAHGLLWTSRKDDEAKAMMYFGDRVQGKDFVVELDREPVHESPYLDKLLVLAEHIGITRVIGG